MTEFPVTNLATRYIIVFTLPSGAQMAAGGTDDLKFALVPVPKQSGAIRNVLGWETAKEAGQWLKDFRKQVGEEEWPKWWALKPKLDRVVLAN